MLMDNHGAALLTALLAAALAAFLAAAMLSSQQIEIRRLGNIINNDQAYVLSLSLEKWAGNVLINDAGRGGTDYPAEAWNAGLPPGLVDGGRASCAISDLQGIFNLNNLLADNRQLRSYSRRQFIRLLSLCGTADNLAPDIFQWLARQDQTFKFVTPSRLMQVPELEPDEFRRLAPFICALPTPTLLNINTAPSLLTASLAENISLSEAGDMIAARPLNGYKSVTAFIHACQKTGWQTAGIDAQFLTVSSHYFMVKSTVDSGRGHIRLTSILNRSSSADNRGRAAGYQVIIRSLGKI